VEGGILPPGMAFEVFGAWKFSVAVICACVFPPGKMPRLYGRQDARRYTFTRFEIASAHQSVDCGARRLI
jgi:hypothetical protein